MKRALIVLLGAVILASPGGARPADEAGLIVFASNRTETLIPTEARAVDLRTGRSRRLGVVPAAPSRQVWSPAGHTLAFVDESGDLHAVRPDRRPRRLARLLVATDDHPVWSDSGRLIAFLRRDRGRLSLYVVRPTGRGLRRVASRIVHMRDLRARRKVLSWSPDESRVAVVGSLRGRYRLLVAGLRSGRIRTVATGRGRPSDVDWSPDGRRIALRAQVPGERAVVRTIDLESGRIRRVHVGDATPIWSPDGRALALDEKHRLLVLRRGVGRARLVATHGPLSEPPVWSPDSRRLVFVSLRQLVVADAGRRRTRRLLRDSRAFHVRSAAWAGPRSVVYVARRKDPGDLDLHVARADGTGLRALTRNDAGEAAPAWSPDRRRIAFSRARGRTGSDIYVMNADGSGEHRLVSDGGAPTWSSDGARLAFVRNGDIWAVRSDGSGAARLTAGPEADGAPDWSPHGAEIAFARDPDPGTSEIYAIDAASQALRRITFEGRQNVGCLGHWAWAPSWSPDGRRLAYEVERGGSATCDPSRGHAVSIYTVASDGSNRAFVTDGGHHDVADDGALTPTWSPDGTQIAFVSAVSQPEPEYDQWWRIGIVSATGGGFRLITPRTYRAHDPDWSD